jgi:hypothetical protein
MAGRWGGPEWREILYAGFDSTPRAGLAGEGLRTVAERAGVDRRTARRYVEAAVALGLVPGPR